jgi:hypothetical protein
MEGRQTAAMPAYPCIQPPTQYSISPACYHLNTPLLQFAEAARLEIVAKLLALADHIVMRQVSVDED